MKKFVSTMTASDELRSMIASYANYDFREESLTIIINGLSSSISNLREKIEKDSLYSENWFQMDSEYIYGLGMIAFQNYINANIHDYIDTINHFDNQIIDEVIPYQFEHKKKYYEIGWKIDGYEKTPIELIITLANFIKHKEDFDGKDSFDNGTKILLEHFGLNSDKKSTSPKSSIFFGMEILDSKSEMLNIIPLVKSWRESLWICKD